MSAETAARPVFFISDRTGITSETLGHSLLTQFKGVEFAQQSLPFINSIDKARQAVQVIDRAAESSGKIPLVFSTLVDDTFRDIIAEADAHIIDFFDTFIQPLEQELGVQSSHAAGLSHGISDAARYMSRIEAVNFVMHSDDGATHRNYGNADIILVGASRSGKTPTCLYLGLQYGLHAANYPLTLHDVENGRLPHVLKPFHDKLFGLTIKPEHLSNIREQRRQGSVYASLDQCRREVRSIEDVLKQQRIPFVDTSDISIEEIAASIMLQRKLKRRYV
jgi:regulator of PEP synthase PpsR (kinase-PPPase family)